MKLLLTRKDPKRGDTILQPHAVLKVIFCLPLLWHGRVFLTVWGGLRFNILTTRAPQQNSASSITQTPLTSSHGWTLTGNTWGGSAQLYWRPRRRYVSIDIYTEIHRERDLYIYRDRFLKIEISIAAEDIHLYQYRYRTRYSSIYSYIYIDIYIS